MAAETITAKAVKPTTSAEATEAATTSAEAAESATAKAAKLKAGSLQPRSTAGLGSS